MTVQELIDKLELLNNKKATIYWCKPSEHSKRLGEYNIVEFYASFYDGKDNDNSSVVSMPYL